MVGFRGSSQEKWPFEIFRFGYGNDKMVPDPVGSGLRSRAKRRAGPSRRSFSQDGSLGEGGPSRVVLPLVIENANNIGLTKKMT